MSANNLAITKAYRDGADLTEAILDGIKDDVEAWGADTVDNLNQLRLDIFGSSYSFDNDGAANNTTAMNIGQTITPAATGTALNVVATALTTGIGLDLGDADALTSGTPILVASNSSNASSRYLISVTNSNTAATGTHCLEVTQAAAATGIQVNSSGATGTSMRVDCTHATSGQIGSYVQFFRTSNSGYSFFEGASNNGADTDVRLRGDGEISGDAGAYVTPAADYAEMFECIDREGIEPGYFVTVEEGKVRVATDKDPFILGLVSGKPAVVADTDWNRWAHKYLCDEFNRPVRDEKGNRVLNPKFDPARAHQTRQDRPEWVAVGMLGKLNVRIKSAVKSQYVDVDKDGCACAGSKYRVLETVLPYTAKKGYGVLKIVFRGKE